MVEEPYGGLIENAQSEIGQTLVKLGQNIAKHAREMVAASAKPSVDYSDLLAKVQEFRGAYTQVELLNKLVDATAQTMPRVLLLIRKGTQVQGWSGAGFEDSFLQGKLKRVKWPIDQYPEVTRVIQTRFAWLACSM
jgi:hypothetical protein